MPKEVVLSDIRILFASSNGQIDSPGFPDLPTFGVHSHDILPTALREFPCRFSVDLAVLVVLKEACHGGALSMSARHVTSVRSAATWAPPKFHALNARS